jgi:hypothetical protein
MAYLSRLNGPLLIMLRSLVTLKQPPRLWNFFSGTPKYTTKVYPDDLDTTSLALSTLHYEQDLAHSILDEMLDYVDEDGFVQVRNAPYKSRSTTKKKKISTENHH